MKYWLLKSEPGAFSIDDLKDAPKQKTLWDGVRNYQARNFMIHDMEIGDLAFFYHSRCKEIGIVGLMKVVSEALPDPTQFDEKEYHFDPKATTEKPRWFLREFQFVEKFPNTIHLETLKQQPELENFQLLKKGNRLSIMPVEKDYWDFIMALT